MPSYLPSCISIVHAIIVASSDTAEELVSALFVYPLCDCISAHPLRLIVPQRIFWMIIRNLRTFLLSSYVLSSLVSGNVIDQVL